MAERNHLELGNYLPYLINRVGFVLVENFTADALGIKVDIQPGSTATVQIPADAQPGTYDFICSIPGHAEAGMVGTLTVQ